MIKNQKTQPLSDNVLDVIRIEGVEQAAIDKIADRLRDPWSDFISSFKQFKPGQSGFILHGLLVKGDKSGLKIVARNIDKANKQGSYQGGVAISFGDKPSKEKVKAKPAKDAERGTVRIWTPVLEEDWQSGVLVYDKKTAKKASPEVRMAMRNGRIQGWRVMELKTSIGLDFDLSNKDSRANLRQAIELGWNNWYIVWNASRSSVRADAVETSDNSKVIGSEFRAKIGEQIVVRLEEAGDVAFEEADGSERPEDAVLYDCRGRGEQPWKLELLSGKSSAKILYSFDRKGGPLPEDELRDMILNLATEY